MPMPSKLPKPRPHTRTFPLEKLSRNWSCKASDKPQPNAKWGRFFGREAGFMRRRRLKRRWTMNKTLLDANTLISAFDESHADHRRARRFVEGLRRFRTSPQSQGAFLRFFTRPWPDAAGVTQLPRMGTAEAMARLKAILPL